MHKNPFCIIDMKNPNQIRQEEKYKNIRNFSGILIPDIQKLKIWHN